MQFRMGKEVKRRTKLAHSQVTPDRKISYEILQVLVSYYFLKRENPDSKDPLENMRSLHFIQLLHNDLVLRLCKLDDEDNRSWSFRQALKKFGKRPSRRFDDPKLDRLIKEFHDLVKPLRAHRDTYVAHYSKRDRTHLKPPELRPVIRLAVQIGDGLADEKVSYQMESVDLRGEILTRTNTRI